MATKLCGRFLVAAFVVMLAAACTWAWARSAASVQLAPTAILRVDTSRPGVSFEAGAVGLSTETSELTNGHLSADHYRLVRLMRLLGPSVLRIGADSVDFSWWTSSDEPPPAWATNVITPADFYALRGLMKATGWRVLLGVDFGHFEPARVADEAHYAQTILGADLQGIEIGNEPDGYKLVRASGAISLRSSTYGVGEYIREAQAYGQALRAAAPRIAVYGPASSEVRWLNQMGSAVRMFTEVTQHYYPTTTCPNAPASESPPTIEGLLSPGVRQQENETLVDLARVGMVADRPTRIGETNSISYCRQSTPGNPSFAGALWALDWALRAASRGIRGIDFNGSFGTCGNNAQSQNPICAPSRRAANNGYVRPQPEYYGLLAASRLEGGRFVPTSMTADDPLPNITTWATLAPAGRVTIAIDNLATSGLAQPVYIRATGSSATEEQLSGPSAEAKSDVLLGGVYVTGSNGWQPRPTQLPRVQHSFRVVVPPASAVIVTLHQRFSVQVDRHVH